MAIALKMQVLQNFRVRVVNGNLDDVSAHLNGKGACNRPVQFLFLPEPYQQVWLSTLHNWTIKSDTQQWDRMLISTSWGCFFFYLWTNLIIECRWTLIWKVLSLPVPQFQKGNHLGCIPPPDNCLQASRQFLFCCEYQFRQRTLILVISINIRLD